MKVHPQGRRCLGRDPKQMPSKRRTELLEHRVWYRQEDMPKNDCNSFQEMRNATIKLTEGSAGI